MKKWLTILLVWTLMLPFGVFAEQQYCSIEEIIRNTPDSWTGTWETPQGTICVDIPVELPAVETFPALKARKIPAVDAGKLKDYGYVRRNVAGNLTADQKKHILQPDTRPKDVSVFPGREFPRLQSEFISLSCEEILSLFRQEIQRLWGLSDRDYVIHETRLEGPAFHCSYSMPAGEAEPTEDMIVWGEQADDFGRCKVYFHQLLHGIEVNGGTFLMTYADPEGVKIRAALYEETEAAEIDVPLLPFKSLEEVLESQIVSGRLCSVDTIKLGYYRYPDAKDRNIFWLLPAWYVSGTCIRDEKNDSMIRTGRPEPIEMVYQAQTGALYDLRSSDPAVASSVITWKEIGIGR